MKIKIIRVALNEWIDAHILEGKKFQLPSIHEGWRFNFSKQAKIKGVFVYVLITEESPNDIEGCLIYKMIDEVEPYMAYIEIAPHNKGENKIYDLVAGCLIAFACRLSYTIGVGPHKGWLAFDVQEVSKQDEEKLMALYSQKYKAMRVDDTTTMVISPKEGEKLIEKYLSYES